MQGVCLHSVPLHALRCNDSASIGSRRVGEGCASGVVVDLVVCIVIIDL
jgi:hypothetical protein